MYGSDSQWLFRPSDIHTKPREGPTATGQREKRQLVRIRLKLGVRALCPGLGMVKPESLGSLGGRAAVDWA